MKVLACLVPRLYAEHTPRDRDRFSWREAKAMQGTIAARGPLKSLPVRKHHMFDQQDGEVGHVHSSFVAAHPDNPDVGSLWAWLEVTDPATAEHIDAGRVTHCSIEAWRLDKATVPLGVMLCGPQDPSYFKGARIYPPKTVAQHLPPDQTTFDTVPHTMAQPLSNFEAFEAKYKHHVAFPGLKQLDNDAKAASDNGTKAILLGKMTDLMKFITSDVARRERKSAPTETSAAPAVPETPTAAASAQAQTPAPAQSTAPAMDTAPESTPAALPQQAQVPAVMQTGQDVPVNVAGLVTGLRNAVESLHKQVNDTIFAYTNSAGKRTATALNPDYTAAAPSAPVSYNTTDTGETASKRGNMNDTSGSQALTESDSSLLNAAFLSSWADQCA